MTWPPISIVYAQFHEDIILAALFDNKDEGFYVDVGANHEEYHSVTKYFYAKGWRGINVEPIPRLYKQFIKRRPDDINLNYAVSSSSGVLSFREYPKHDGLSTFSNKSKLENEKKKLPYKDYDVKVEKLSTIFKQNKVNKLDFLKIDVEGYEEGVLKSNDWNKFRPTVICIEANHRDDSDWGEYLERQGYFKAIFDGLNEYYISKDSSGILDDFAEKASILTHNSIRSHFKSEWDSDKRMITKLEAKIKEQEIEIERLRIIEANLRSLKFLTKREIGELAMRLGIKK